MKLDGKSLHVLVPMYGGWNAQNFLQSFHRLALCSHAIKSNGVHYENLKKFYDLAIEKGAIDLPPAPQLPPNACSNFDFDFSFVYNESLISRARNRLADIFLKGCECTHALFIDADIGFEPEDVFKMMELDKDIIGVPCVKKSLVWDRIQRAVRGAKRPLAPFELERIGGDFVFNFERFEGMRDMNLTELQEMRNLGTGMLMIKREVFQEFKKAYGDRWFEPKTDTSWMPGPVHDFFKCAINPETREYDSEDYWFCMDAKAIGFKIWMMPWAKTSHFGTYMFQGDMQEAAKHVEHL